MEKQQKRGRDRFSKYKGVISFLVKLNKLLPYKMRLRKFIRCRNKTGILGILKRYVLLKTLCKECGDNVVITEGVYILNPKNLSLGNNVSIHSMSYVEAKGEIYIGNDVSIAHGATLMSTTHNYSDKDIPIKDQGVEGKPIIIKNNVWIGAKSTILCGLTIEEGSIVGANSVVTKNVEANTIVAGAPAKVIKTR